MWAKDDDAHMIACLTSAGVHLRRPALLQRGGVGVLGVKMSPNGICTEAKNVVQRKLNPIFIHLYTFLFAWAHFDSSHPVTFTVLFWSWPIVSAFSYTCEIYPTAILNVQSVLLFKAKGLNLGKIRIKKMIDSWLFIYFAAGLSRYSGQLSPFALNNIFIRSSITLVISCTVQHPHHYGSKLITRRP